MGHTLRHGGLLKDILEREVGKKRGRGRPRAKYFDQIIRDMGCKTFRDLTILPSPTLSTRWLTEEMSLPFPFTIDTTTADAPMN